MKCASAGSGNLIPGQVAVQVAASGCKWLLGASGLQVAAFGKFKIRVICTLSANLFAYFVFFPLCLLKFPEIPSVDAGERVLTKGAVLGF